jgi:hypothetical protein
MRMNPRDAAPQDPEKSVPLYEKHYGMKLMDVYHYADRSHYFLARPRDSQVHFTCDALIWHDC